MYIYKCKTDEWCDGGPIIKTLFSHHKKAFKIFSPNQKEFSLSYCKYALSTFIFFAGASANPPKPPCAKSDCGCCELSLTSPPSVLFYK